MALTFEPGPLTLIEVTWSGDPRDLPSPGTVVVRGPVFTDDNGKPVTPPYVTADEFEVKLGGDGKPILPAEIGILDEIKLAEKKDYEGRKSEHYTAVIAVGCTISREKVVGLTPENEAKITELKKGARLKSRLSFTGHHASFENQSAWLGAQAEVKKPTSTPTPPKPKPAPAPKPSPKPAPAPAPAAPVAPSPSAPQTPSAPSSPTDI